MSDHNHTDAYHQTNVDNQTPEWKHELRRHMKAKHDASADWAAMLEADLIAERHNWIHGRDALGREL